MAFNNSRKREIIDTIKKCLRNKFLNYNPKGTQKPFHFRLLGKDRMELFSFIHSLNTTFGTSIFEPVAKKIAKNKFVQVESQYKVGNEISNKAQNEIQKIMNYLSLGNDVNKSKEIEIIRKVASQGEINKISTIKADIFLKDNSNNIYLFDIKTAKPNKSNFKDFKRTLLEWTAITLLKEPNAKIHTLIAIPYNPYEPHPYEFWTIKGMIDLDEEIMIADNFWNFLGGANTYENLLDCFQTAGNEMRTEIDDYFLKFK
jgi:type II restriction enzyme